MRFSITTLGCKVNSYESNYYKEQLEKHGHQMVEPIDPCDVCIINTCTVTNTAAAKSRQKIHSLKKSHPNALIVVVGCYVQHANQTERENLDVDLIIGANHKNELVQRIEELLRIMFVRIWWKIFATLHRLKKCRSMFMNPNTVLF